MVISDICKETLGQNEVKEKSKQRHLTEAHIQELRTDLKSVRKRYKEAIEKEKAQLAELTRYNRKK